LKLKTESTAFEATSDKDKEVFEWFESLEGKMSNFEIQKEENQTVAVVQGFKVNFFLKKFVLL
jgi:murein L,D-transpeptidase YafK